MKNFNSKNVGHRKMLALFVAWVGMHVWRWAEKFMGWLRKSCATAMTFGMH